MFLDGTLYFVFSFCAVCEGIYYFYILYFYWSLLQYYASRLLMLFFSSCRFKRLVCYLIDSCCLNNSHNKISLFSQAFKPIATVASDIVKKNGFGDKISVVGKRSTKLELEKGKTYTSV